MSVDYVSRKVMDRYFDKFTRKLVRINIRIMEMEAAWNRLTLLFSDYGPKMAMIDLRLDDLEASQADTNRPA